MAYNLHDLHLQKHTLSFPPGDMQPVTTPPKYQYTQSSETWQHKGLYTTDKRFLHISGLAVHFQASMCRLPVTESLLQGKT